MTRKLAPIPGYRYSTQFATFDDYRASRPLVIRMRPNSSRWAHTYYLDNEGKWTEDRRQAVPCKTRAEAVEYLKIAGWGHLYAKGPGGPQATVNIVRDL
jgi:hypothetical protein